jgi:hypothetical protein
MGAVLRGDARGRLILSGVAVWDGPSFRITSCVLKLGAGGERVRLASERGELLAEIGEVDALGVGAAD